MIIMRVMIAIIVSAIAVWSADSYFFGGVYTHGIVQMFSDINGSFHHG